ncbi:membrane-spanning 4-domains subfamily A member 4A-like isoform X5 [Notamacropus eugenii]|uniref:membrane-spanning 4-domains subfamily A member 4A-like isoform X5 n=1 Tax=Notamacropus eugenii TaxID=9315 RepID=UPI003B682C26
MPVRQAVDSQRTADQTREEDRFMGSLMETQAAPQGGSLNIPQQGPRDAQKDSEMELAKAAMEFHQRKNPLRKFLKGEPKALGFILSGSLSIAAENRTTKGLGINGLLLVFTFLEFIIAITLAGFGCPATCCNQGEVTILMPFSPYMQEVPTAETPKEGIVIRGSNADGDKFPGSHAHHDI